MDEGEDDLTKMTLNASPSKINKFTSRARFASGIDGFITVL